jgi:hypothetical protein
MSSIVVQVAAMPFRNDVALWFQLWLYSIICKNALKSGSFMVTWWWVCRWFSVYRNSQTSSNGSTVFTRDSHLPAKNLHCEVTLWSIHSEEHLNSDPGAIPGVASVFCFWSFSIRRKWLPKNCRFLSTFLTMTQSWASSVQIFCSLGAIVSGSVRLEGNNPCHPQRSGPPCLNPFP